MWYVMWLQSHASSLSIKIKIKRKSKEKNIKSRKIDKRKRKILVSKYTITMGPLWGVCAAERQLASWGTVTEGLKGRVN